MSCVGWANNMHPLKLCGIGGGGAQTKMIQEIYNFRAQIIHFSWCVFWINADKLPERISIGIALILAQLILIVGEQQEFPNTSDFKLIDIYLLLNFFINVAALIETIFAALLSEMAASRKWKRQNKKLPPASAKDQEVSSASEVSKVLDN